MKNFHIGIEISKEKQDKRINLTDFFITQKDNVSTTFTSIYTNSTNKLISYLCLATNRCVARLAALKCRLTTSNPKDFTGTQCGNLRFQRSKKKEKTRAR